MNFRSIENLNQTIVASIPRLPRDIDLIVGIPRSGLLAANIIALHLNLPLADLDGFLEGRLLGRGTSRTPAHQASKVKDCKKILVVDDSVNSGHTIEKTKKKISDAHIKQQIIYGSVYVTPGRENDLDFYFQICSCPRVFEWNLMHHPELINFCLDIDGVLCVDPTDRENDDGQNYLTFLENATPLFVPTVPVGILVSSRLEKYRPQTEEWLSRNNIKYKDLVLLDLPSKEHRIRANAYGAFKAGVYRESDAELFIESSLSQSIEIAEKSGKPVFSVESRNILYPSQLSSAKKTMRDATRRYMSPLREVLLKTPLLWRLAR